MIKKYLKKYIPYSIMMEYKKIINLLENTANWPTKFSTKNWVEINDDARGQYNKNSEIKFKASMLKSILFDYSDAYILASGAITVAALETGGGNSNEMVNFEKCVPFTDCISEINNMQVHDTN